MGHLRSANWALGGTSNAEILQSRFFPLNFETLNLLKLSFEKVTCRALTLFILFTCLTWNMSFNIHPSSLFDWWFRTNLKKGWSTNLAHHVRHVHYAKRKSPRGELKAFVLIISSFVCRKIIFNFKNQFLKCQERVVSRYQKFFFQQGFQIDPSASLSTQLCGPIRKQFSRIHLKTHESFSNRLWCHEMVSLLARGRKRKCVLYGDLELNHKRPLIS